MSRRGLLGGAAGAAGAAVGLGLSPPGAAAASTQCREKASLAQRLDATVLSPLGPSLNPLAPQELYYPEWVFGQWSITATLARKQFPFGEDKVPKSLVEGSPRNRKEAVGDSTTYEIRYFSTLADTPRNNAVTQLGLGMPKSEIILDRAFSAASLNKAYDQLAKVSNVEWDYSKDPTRLTVNFAPSTTADMQPIGPRRVEAYITARAAEPYTDCAGGGEGFLFTEKSRSVTLQPRSVVVTDLENIVDYRRVSDGVIEGRSRTAYFLSPNPNSREGVLWQEVGGKAVAIFDYDIRMERMIDAKVGRPCVDTPKGYTQCY